MAEQYDCLQIHTFSCRLLSALLLIMTVFNFTHSASDSDCLQLYTLSLRYLHLHYLPSLLHSLWATFRSASDNDCLQLYTLSCGLVSALLFNFTHSASDSDCLQIYTLSATYTYTTYTLSYTLSGLLSALLLTMTVFNFTHSPVG